jgi:hypothetical protein
MNQGPVENYDKLIDDLMSAPLTLEGLRAIEEQTVELGKLTMPIAKPQLADLGRFAAAVEIVVRKAPQFGFDLYLFDLPQYSAKKNLPTIEELKADPELLRVITYFENLKHHDLKVVTRGVLPNVTPQAGAIYADAASYPGCPRAVCLVLENTHHEDKRPRKGKRPEKFL